MIEWNGESGGKIFISSDKAFGKAFRYKSDDPMKQYCKAYARALDAIYNLNEAAHDVHGFQNMPRASQKQNVQRVVSKFSWKAILAIGVSTLGLTGCHKHRTHRQHTCFILENLD